MIGPIFRYSSKRYGQARQARFARCGVSEKRAHSGMAVAIPFFCAAGRKVREEHMDISFSAIAACWASAALCIVLPIALLVIVRVKTHRGLLAALTGALCFTVSALVLEQLLHSIVFSSFPTLIQSPGLYTAYACLAAGVFEETARYLGLSLLCRRDASLVTGFAYGIGHGGIEAILLAGTASLSNAIVPVSYTHLDVYKRQLHS